MICILSSVHAALQSSCASCGGTEKGSKRAEIKELIHELAQEDPVTLR